MKSQARSYDPASRPSSRQESAEERTASSQMFWSKAFYFLYYSAAAALIPYLVIYYDLIGLSGRQIGLLAGIAPLVTLVCAPLWTGYADRTGLHKLVLNIAVAGAALAPVLLSVFTRFVFLIPIVIAYAFFVSPVIPLADNSAVTLLGSAKNRYGRLRLWGAIGWGIAGPVIGWMVDHDGIRWSFMGYFFLMATVLIVINRLPLQNGGIRTGFWSGLRTLSSNRRWLGFLALVFTGGVSLSAVSNYLFLYMGELGASKTIMGFALTMATLSEIIILFYGDRFLGRFGPAGVLKIAMFFTGTRLIAYSLASFPAPVLLIQLLHGVTFAAIWIAGVSYASEIAPQGLGGTAQGIFSGTIFGLSAAVGAMLGGALYQQFGAVTMFRSLGLSTLLITVLYVVVENRLLVAAAPS